MVGTQCNGRVAEPRPDAVVPGSTVNVSVVRLATRKNCHQSCILVHVPNQMLPPHEVACKLSYLQAHWDLDTLAIEHTATGRIKLYLKPGKRPRGRLTFTMWYEFGRILNKTEKYLRNNWSIFVPTNCMRENW